MKAKYLWVLLPIMAMYGLSYALYALRPYLDVMPVWIEMPTVIVVSLLMSTGMLAILAFSGMKIFDD